MKETVLSDRGPKPIGPYSQAIDFAAMNEVYGRYFTSAPPARSTVQVARLPKDALVEIEVIAAV